MTSIPQSRTRTPLSSQTQLVEGQKPHSITTQNKDQGIEHFTKIIEETKKMVLDSMLIASKSQMIDGGNGGGNISGQLLQSTTTLANLQMQEIQMKQTMQNMELQKQSSFAQMSNMVGQRVSIEDGTRNFSGKVGELVKFQYNILGKDIPASAVIQTEILLSDKDGKKIFSKTEKGKHIGQNSFAWDGKNSDGNKAPPGSYNISVTASYTIPGTKNAPIPLIATTEREGTVDEVTRDEDDNINLIVDGQKVDRTSIRGITRGGKNDSNESKDSIDDYIHYIDKTVQVKQEKVNFNRDKANVPFISKDAAEDAKVEVRFFDSTGNFVAYSQNIQNIQKGQNNFSWKGEDAKSEAALKDMRNNKIFQYVPAGVYRYEVSLTTKDEAGTETTHKLDNKGEFIINSIDKASGKIMLVSGEYKFDIKDITQLMNKTPEKPQASYLQGIDFINKVVSFKDDTALFNGESNLDIQFTIPNPGVDYELNSAMINFMDNKGTVVASILKPQAEIYTADSEAIPANINTIDDINAIFSNDSKANIKEAYAEAFPDGKINDMKGIEHNFIKHYIAKNFRAGNLFLAEYDNLNQVEKEAQRMKNMGSIKATWDGTGIPPNNQKLPKGDYKVAISYEIKNKNDNTLVSKNLDLTHSRKVTGTYVQDNQVMLQLNNGMTIASDKVLLISA